MICSKRERGTAREFAAKAPASPHAGEGNANRSLEGEDFAKSPIVINKVQLLLFFEVYTRGWSVIVFTKPFWFIKNSSRYD